MPLTNYVCFTCVCAVIFVPSVWTFCPFGGALDHGRRAQLAEAQRRADLIADNCLIDTGQPASLIWSTDPRDNATIALYDRSVALLYAERFYVEQVAREVHGPARERIKDRRKDTDPRTVGQTLRPLTRTVAAADRCREQPLCDANEKFSSVDGSCYSLRLPTLGSSFSPYSRLLPALFDDGIYSVRLSKRQRSSLPSPRLIGNVALQHSVYEPRPDFVPNHGSLIFGQYITHDGGFKDVYQNYAGGSALRCCSADNKRALPSSVAYAHCMPVVVPADDPFYGRFGGGCLDYIRSQPVFSDRCELGAAEISSSVTQHLDHSTIYGSTAEALRTVRAYRDGLLLNSPNRLFPRKANCSDEFCYFTGDIRGAFYPTLSLWHSIFIRFHNQVAELLARLNGHWTDERLFQETRRLITAVYHNIVFNEWLPPYIGQAAARRRNVSTPETLAQHGLYDERINGASMQEFSAGVFRVFHANTPDDINMYDRQYELRRRLPLNESMHGPTVLEREYLGMMRGFFRDPISLGGYPDNIRDTVFNNDNANGIGLDLLSVDILRGRDHGLQPYHVYLELYWRQFGNAAQLHKRVRSWQDLRGIFSTQSIAKLQEVYEGVHDIDLLVGLLLEEKCGTLLGPVGVMLMEEQFHRYKFGNRFHYALKEGAAYPMTEAQILSINRMRFADVLCWCSNIEAVPRQVFRTISDDNPLQECSGYVLDVELWREAQ